MTKTRSIISETIIGKDEPLQPFRSAMIRDTGDVVARVAFLRRTAAEMRAKRNLRGAMEIEKIADEQERAALHQEGIAPE